MKKTNDTNLKEKLEYLNLDLENIPEFLEKYTPLDFRVSNGVSDNEQIVYKHVPINKIQILITPTTKSEELRKKYSESLPISRYASMKNDEDVERYTVFLNMLNTMDISEIQAIEEEQAKLDKAIPFKVKYPKNFLWQIYYSQVTDTYFMLVPTEDMEYNHMFYLLKEQIKFANSKKKIAPKIYVPINHLEYSREIYSKSEIKDIENYLWLLTSEWVNVYEVYDKKNKPSMHIIGEAKVYDNIKTEYKVKLADREEALDFYKLLKALFILKTELNQYYKFDVKINSSSELELYYNSEKLSLDILPIFIKREYKRIGDELVRKNLSSNQMEQVLSNMKMDCLKKEKEFLDKEKEIATFLEYKKTFFGKIKIFFSGKKKKDTNSNSNTQNTNEQKESLHANSQDVLEQIIQTKPNYTIEDLVIVYSMYDKKVKHLKDLEMDIDALELKIKNLEKKIENATLYIKEIEQHKKSIFEFWKFANKDEMPALVAGETSTTKKKLSKSFNYEFDFEEFGNKMDKLQRNTLTKEEMNSIFLAKTNIIKGINIVRKAELDNSDEKELKKLLENLKEELNNEETGRKDFDIFGSMLEDRTQIKTIANKHHREVEKNKLQILNISKRTTMDEFIETLKEISKNIETAIDKVKSSYNMPLYKAMATDELPTDSLNVWSIDPISCIKEHSGKEIDLYKIHLKEGQNAVFYTNIIFFDNNNQTLPMGMNLSNEVLLDTRDVELKITEKKKFMTNLYSENSEDAAKLNVMNVNVFEYKII